MSDTESRKHSELWHQSAGLENMRAIRLASEWYRRGEADQPRAGSKGVTRVSETALQIRQFLSHEAYPRKRIDFWNGILVIAPNLDMILTHLKFPLRYPTVISIIALIGMAACFYLWENSSHSTGSVSEPAAGVASAVKSSPAPPVFPKFSASDPTAMKEMKSILKRCAEEGRLTQEMVIGRFEELKEGGASGKQMDDLAEFVRSLLIPFDCEGYLRICSYLSAGNEKAVLTQAAAGTASPEDIPRMTEIWKAIQNDDQRRKIGEILINRFFTRPDKASITQAFDFMDASVGDDRGRSEVRYMYAFKLQEALLQSENDPAARVSSREELLGMFSAREAVPLLSYYVSKAMESGDISKMETLLGDDPKYQGFVVGGALSIAKGIGPDVAVTILERIPDDGARIDSLKFLAEAVKRRAGDAAAARFTQEHYTESEIKLMKESTW